MGCRKYKGRQWVDDLDGQTHLPEELEELAFAFDGVAKVIHLNRENAAAFREAMAPFMDAAQDAPKSKVLATLPRKRRHLHSVPLLVDPEPREEAQEPPISQEGEESEPLSGPEGTRVPEAPSMPADSSSSEPAPRPALSMVREPIPEMWAPYAPERRDDKSDHMLKARQWAGAMGSELRNNMVTPDVLARWENFYRERRWLLQ